MKGLTAKAVEAIEGVVKNHFDRLALEMLGIIPKKSKEKHIVFSTSKKNLMSLFFQALSSRNPNQLEEDTLSTILRVATGYIDALRDRTSSRIVQDVDSYVRNQNLKKQDISANKIKEVMHKEMGKAKNHFKMIANAESNKAVNVGVALKISKIAEEKGEEDPVVYFAVTIDDVTGPEEFVLHLLPDRKTPRLWKLSEIGSEYHKKGDPNPKFPGLHPNCRCKIAYLPKGWGFNADGKVKFVSLDHEEFASQRETFPLPR